MSIISRVKATEPKTTTKFHSHFISIALDSISDQHMHSSVQVSSHANQTAVQQMAKRVGHHAFKNEMRGARDEGYNKGRPQIWGPSVHRQWQRVL